MSKKFHFILGGKIQSSKIGIIVKNFVDFFTWCIGCLEVFLPESGGLLMSIVCIARMSGPVKHCTTSKTCGKVTNLESSSSHTKSWILLTRRSFEIPTES